MGGLSIGQLGDTKGVGVENGAKDPIEGKGSSVRLRTNRTLDAADDIELNNESGRRGLKNGPIPETTKKGLPKNEIDDFNTNGDIDYDILFNNNMDPKEVTGLHISEDATNIGTGAFKNTRNLKGDITGGDSITNIGPLSFMGSGAIRLGSLMGGLTENIGQGAFVDSGVKGPIVLPQNINTVGSEAFRGTKITSLEITGDSMTIGSNAFRDCSDLKRVRIEVGPEVFTGTGHFQVGTSRSRFTVSTIEVDTTNSTVFGLPKKKFLMRPNVPESYTFIAQDLNEIEYTEIQYNGTLNIYWENGGWHIGQVDDYPVLLDALYEKVTVANSADYYDPNPNAQYRDPYNDFGYIKVRILDRDKPDQPNYYPRLYVRAQDFQAYNSEAFRNQTGFSGTIIALDP